MGDNEDSIIVEFPVGKALVQTVDFFTPIVNDPFRFGEIAAANSLSDIYAMGATPWTAMNIVCFPACDDVKILQEILAGGQKKILEAGAIPAGGHSVDDLEIKYGLSVSGYIDKEHMASNRGAKKGDIIILTKAVGTGVLSTAIKANWENSDLYEDILWQSASQLNKIGGMLIQKEKLLCATDITGFGLGGHLIEIAEASGVSIELSSKDIPILSHVLELANMGLVPAGSIQNRLHYKNDSKFSISADNILTEIIFDAQSSGGLALFVPEEKLKNAEKFLSDNNQFYQIIGHVVDKKEKKLIIQ